MRAITIVSTAVVFALASCSSSPKPEPPAPQPSAAELAQEQHVRDSLAAVVVATADSMKRVATADSLARASEMARQAATDSVERARVAVEQAAATRDQELRTELAVMIHFDTDASKLLTDGQASLDRKIAILNANPDVRLRITGATDDRGSVEYNMALGRRRAATVKRYLIAQGISDSRLEEATAGEGSPLESGDNESAWALNRRAEFVLVGDNSPLAMR